MCICSVSKIAAFLTVKNILVIKNSKKTLLYKYMAKENFEAFIFLYIYDFQVYW